MPTRPININAIMISLPNKFKCDVTPMLIPVVPKAAITSKIISSKVKLAGKCCVRHNSKIAAARIAKATKTSVSARKIFSSLKRRLPKTVSRWPFKVAILCSVNSPTVVVLIPPAVDPGVPPNKHQDYRYRDAGRWKILIGKSRQTSCPWRNSHKNSIDETMLNWHMWKLSS